jgi:hypothetical protein
MAVLLLFPVALSPWWWRRMPGAGLRERLWLLPAGLVLLSTLPHVLITALGLAGVSVAALSWVLVLLCVLAGLVGWTAARRLEGNTSAVEIPASAEPGRRDGDSVPGRRTWIIAFTPALLVLVLSIVHKTPLGATDDSFDHLASLRHIAETGRVEFPGAFYAVDPPRGQDPRKGVLLPALALAVRSSRADSADVWKESAIVLAPLMVLAFTSLAFALFRSAGLAFVSALALLLSWGGPFWLLRGAYGGHWGLAAAWAGTALFLCGAGLGWGVVAGVTTAALHAYAPFQLLVPTGIFYVLGRAGRPPGPAVRLSALVGAAAGAVPLLVARKLLAGPTMNALHAQSMAWLLTPAGPIASPLDLLAWFGYAGAFALIAVVVLFFFHRDRAGLYLIGSAAGPLFLLLNPLLFAPVAGWLGSVANKLALVWSYPLVIAWIAGTAASKRARPVRVAGAVLGVVLVSLIALPFPARVDAWSRGAAPLAPGLRMAMVMLRRSTPPDAVVASDPLTSYAVPALTGRRVIVTLHQHSPPGDTRATERLELASELFSTCVPLEAILQRTAREGAGWVLYGGAREFRFDEFGNHGDPRNNRLLESRFAGRPDLLDPVAGKSPGGPALYRVNLAPQADVLKPGELKPAAGTPRAVPEPPTGPIITDGTVSFAVESLPLKSVRRGDVIRLPAAWRLEQPAEGYLEYSGHIRFESEALPSFKMPISLISKPFRRIILEPRVGGSYRWRAVEVPFRGLCPIGSWPVGSWLPDTLEVTVPRELLPGRCSLRVGLERGSLYPVLSSADLFQDTDRFSAPTAGLLEIE